MEGRLCEDRDVYRSGAITTEGRHPPETSVTVDFSYSVYCVVDRSRGWTRRSPESNPVPDWHDRSDETWTDGQYGHDYVGSPTTYDPVCGYGSW